MHCLQQAHKISFSHSLYWAESIIFQSLSGIKCSSNIQHRSHTGWHVCPSPVLARIVAQGSWWEKRLGVSSGVLLPFPLQCLSPLMFGASGANIIFLLAPNNCPSLLVAFSWFRVDSISLITFWKTHNQMLGIYGVLERPQCSRHTALFDLCHCTLYQVTSKPLALGTTCLLVIRSAQAYPISMTFDPQDIPHPCHI